MGNVLNDRLLINSCRGVVTFIFKKIHIFICIYVDNYIYCGTLFFYEHIINKNLFIMPKLTPKEAQEKHAANLIASVPYMEKGILRVTEAPGKKAAAAQAKMKANIVKAIDSGKWANRVSAVPLADWQQKMIEKGLARIPGGIEAAAAKTEAFYDKFFPYLDTIAGKLKDKPSVTLQDNIQRMIFQITEASKFKR